MPKGTKLQREATELARTAGINYTQALRRLTAARDADEHPDVLGAPTAAHLPQLLRYPTGLPEADILLNDAQQGCLVLGPAVGRQGAEIRPADEHTLIIGLDRSGRTNLLQLVARDVTLLPDQYRLHLFDGAETGQLAWADPTPDGRLRYDMEDEAAEFADLVDLIRRRQAKKLSTGRKRLVLIDNLDRYLEHERWAARIAVDLGFILMWGPAVGVHVIATTGTLGNTAAHPIAALWKQFTCRILTGPAGDGFGRQFFGQDTDTKLAVVGRGLIQHAGRQPALFQAYLADVPGPETLPDTCR